jgi:hypothetical protein
MNAEFSQERKQQIVNTVAGFLKRNRKFFYTSGLILRRLRHHPPLQGISESMLDRILLEHEQTQVPLIIQSRRPLGKGLDHWWKASRGWKPTWPLDEGIKKATSRYRPDAYAGTRHSFFISYTSTDLDVALSFRDALNARGYGGFIAHVENNNSTDAIEFVRRYLPPHDYYVTCLSISAIKSAWVREEWYVVRDELKKPCLILLNGRDEALLEVLANVDDSQLHHIIEQDKLLSRLLMDQSKDNRKWARATLIPFLREVREEATMAGATLCWPPVKKLAATFVKSWHIRSFDDTLACFCSSIKRSGKLVLPSKPEVLPKERRRKKPKRPRRPFDGRLVSGMRRGNASPPGRGEASPDWNSLFRRWVLEQPRIIRMTAREATDYVDSATLDAHYTGLLKSLSALPENTIVIGHWAYESDGEGGSIGYLTFYLASNMEDVGVATDLLSFDMPESNTQDDFARWALDQIKVGNLS